MSNVVMRHKSAFLQQGGPLGPDDLGYISLHLGVQGGIPTSQALLHLVPKTGLFLEEASSSVVPSLAHCMYCIITLPLAEFQTLLKFAAGFLIIAMRVSHRSCCRRKLLSRWISFFTLLSARVFSVVLRNRGFDRIGTVFSHPQGRIMRLWLLEP